MRPNRVFIYRGQNKILQCPVQFLTFGRRTGNGHYILLCIADLNRKQHTSAICIIKIAHGSLKPTPLLRFKCKRCGVGSRCNCRGHFLLYGIRCRRCVVPELLIFRDNIPAKSCDRITQGILVKLGSVGLYCPFVFFDLSTGSRCLLCLQLCDPFAELHLFFVEETLIAFCHNKHSLGIWVVTGLRVDHHRPIAQPV